MEAINIKELYQDYRFDPTDANKQELLNALDRMYEGFWTIAVYYHSVGDMENEIKYAALNQRVGEVEVFVNGGVKVARNTLTLIQKAYTEILPKLDGLDGICDEEPNLSTMSISYTPYELNTLFIAMIRILMDKGLITCTDLGSNVYRMSCGEYPLFVDLDYNNCVFIESVGDPAESLAQAFIDEEILVNLNDFIAIAFGLTCPATREEFDLESFKRIS